MQIRTILHPTDYSDVSQAALQYAVELAHHHGATLIVLHAVESLGPEEVTYGEAISQRQPDGYRKRLWNELHQVSSPDPEVAIEYVLMEGDPVAAIIRTATDHNCDLIVLGSHGRHGWQRLLEGSVAEWVMRAAPCPVLIVKHPVKPIPSQPGPGPERHLGQLPRR